jgi:ATP-dependent DNA helicase RecQ
MWEALRDCRRQFAADQGVPPYVIFHDNTLQEMCVLLPQSMTEFARLTGVGERKLEKYGADFLQVINQHLQA